MDLIELINYLQFQHYEVILIIDTNEKNIKRKWYCSFI